MKRKVMINGPYMKVNFDNASNSDRFYNYLSSVRIPSKELKLKYSKYKWDDLPDNIKRKILSGYYN
jgi:hypothetical protein